MNPEMEIAEDTIAKVTKQSWKYKDGMWSKEFRPGYQAVWPGDGSDPYIEFTWRENEKPKRYKLEAFVEKLAEMGILQEIEEDCRTSAMEKSSEALRAYWANPTYSFSRGIRTANAGAVCAHSHIRFEDGNAICESCGEALKLVKVPSPHAPATPPQEG